MPLARNRPTKQRANGRGLLRERSVIARIPQIAPRKLKGLAGGQDEFFAGTIPPVDHMRALRVTGWLSNVQRRLHDEDAFQMEPEDVIRALNRAGVKFVLMGAHAVNGWTRVERATQDVDVLVHNPHHRKAVAAIKAAYPELAPEENPVVTRFRDSTGRVRIDLMRPDAPVHKMALKTTVLVRQSHMVPKLEMLLACKLAAMVSPNRAPERKHMDAADFSLLVKHNKDDINRVRLRSLGETVYAGGGAEILRLVDDVLAGRMLVF